MGVCSGISMPIMVDDWTSLDGDHDMDDDYDSSSTDLEDSTGGSEYSSMEETFSEYDGETCGKQPAKKRARAAQALDTGMAPVTKGSGKKKKTLSLIVTMSIDILLEIFSLLEPADLLYLSRTSKAFRKVLLSNNAVSVWKAARVNRGGVPDCMPSMSEVTWANLLFGGSQCYVCGTKGIRRIDFGIRRRVCTTCLEENLVYKPDFSLEFPEFDPIIMDLIPFSDRYGWARGRASGSQFFWSDDVLKMAAQLEMYQKDVHMFKSGAKKRLEDFKQSRKRYVDSVVDHAAVCNTWVDEDRERHLLTVARLRGQNTELIKARLVHLGHNANDVARMFRYRGYAMMDKELTDARWKRLLPKIERNLSELKKKWRLEDQRNASSRREIHLLGMYGNYVQQLPRALTPPSEFFLKLCDVADFINSPPPAEQECEINACRAFADKFPEICTRYTHQMKLSLMQLLGLSTGVSQDILVLQNLGINAPDETLLQLATSIFQCIPSRPFPLITWDKVQYHKCLPRVSYTRSMQTAACTFSISQSGITAARSLLSLVGLDAETTTATTMDQLQCHFFCSNCPPKPENGGSFRMAMDWRRSVIHYVEESHAEPRWELLSAAQLEVIQGSRPPEYPRATDPVWCCNKCDGHRGKPVKKAAVIDHMRSHGIAAPNQGVDFSYVLAPDELPPPGTKFFVTPPQLPTKDYRCIRCKGSLRSFVLSGVKQHIKHKHKIGSPCEGIDFCKIK